MFAVDSAAADHNDNNRETPAWVSIKTRSGSHNTGPINVVARDSNTKNKRFVFEYVITLTVPH